MYDERDFAVNAMIERIVALKAQKKALEAEEESLEKALKAFLAETSRDEYQTMNGHTVSYKGAPRMQFSSKKMIAELGQQAYDRFKVESVVKTFLAR